MAAPSGGQPARQRLEKWRGERGANALVRGSLPPGAANAGRWRDPVHPKPCWRRNPSRKASRARPGRRESPRVHKALPHQFRSVIFEPLRRSQAAAARGGGGGFGAAPSPAPSGGPATQHGPRAVPDVPAQIFGPRIRGLPRRPGRRPSGWCSPRPFPARIRPERRPGPAPRFPRSPGAKKSQRWDFFQLRRSLGPAVEFPRGVFRVLKTPLQLKRGFLIGFNRSDELGASKTT